jgi:hypothetical protein
MSISQAKSYIQQALSGAFGSTFAQRRGYTVLSCPRQSPSRVTCTVTFHSGPNLYAGSVVVFYLVSNGKTYWNDQYKISWANGACLAAHRKNCQTHTKSGS